MKVEIGFTNAGANPPFFTLDDLTKGVLDSSLYVLGGGEGFVDVTEYAREVSIQRGKSRELDRYNAGQASVSFNNSSRAFDPTYEASPFYGQIVPKRKLRISVDNVVQFVGVIDDWSLDYDQSGYSVASCQAFDAFSQLSGLTTTSELSLSEELSGSRINELLDAVLWPETEREIDTGRANLAAQTLPAETAVLDYLQQVADSEPGDVFVNKSGNVEFQDRANVATSSSLVFSDDSGIPYQAIQAVYGSELLYNYINVTSSAGTAVTSDEYSIALYGQRDLNLDTLLQGDLITLADVLLARYKDPEFRFEGLTVNLRDVTSEQRTALLSLDLSDVIKVELSPGNVGPAIERYGKVLKLDYSFTPDTEMVSIGLESGAGQFLVLDDLAFGKLDSGVLGW